MTATPEYARPVRLPRRSRQGVVMGMDPWQLAFLATAALILLVFVNRFGPLGLLYGAPLYLGFGVTALTSIHGVSTPRMAGLWLMKQVRDETQLKGPGRAARASRRNVRVVPWGDEQGVVDGGAP